MHQSFPTPRLSVLGLLLGELGPVLLEVRGLAQAVVVPCFVTNIQRSEARHFALGLSQRLVFGSTAILGAGLYLALMAAAAYYVRSIGGTSGHAVQTVFLFDSVLLLIAFPLPGHFRSNVKHFLAEHLQQQNFASRHASRTPPQRTPPGHTEDRQEGT